MFNMLSAIVQFETELRKEGQFDGIIKALEKGVEFGAKAKMTDPQVQHMKLDRDTGVIIRDLSGFKF